MQTSMQMGLIPPNVAAFPFHLRTDTRWQYRFQTVLADTQEARRISFRLRYQVFCEETGFEDPKSFPDKLEQDIFDGASTVFLVWDRLTSKWAGTMRLVEGRKTALPTETICWPTPLLDLDANRPTAVEFSRLCVPPEFRRIHSGSHYIDTRASSEKPSYGRDVLRQEDDEILLRLILALLGWAQDNEIQYCYYLINAALARVLKHLHVPLVTAGPQVEHRGKRKPYKTDIEKLAAELKEKSPQARRILHSDVPYSRHSRFSGAASTKPVRQSASPYPPAVHASHNAKIA